MEIKRLVPLYGQIRNGGIVAYSILAVAAIIPGVSSVLGVALVPYYLLIPGYCATTLLGKNEGFIELLFFSVCWSLAIIASVFAIDSLGLARLPLGVAVPVIAVFLFSLAHYKTRR